MKLIEYLKIQMKKKKSKNLLEYLKDKNNIQKKETNKKKPI